MKFETLVKLIKKQNKEYVKNKRHTVHHLILSELILKALEEDDDLSLSNTLIKETDIETFTDMLYACANDLSSRYSYSEYGERRDYDPKKLQTTEIVQSEHYKDLSKKIQDASFFSLGVLLFQSNKNEVACKFSSKKERNRFISSLGGRYLFPEDHDLKGKQCFFTNENIPDTFYIHALMDKKNKVLTVFFPNSYLRKLFTDLMNLAGNEKIAWDKSNKDNLCFDIKELSEDKTILTLPTPFCTSEVGFNRLAMEETSSFFRQIKVPTVIVDIVNDYLEYK